LHSGIFLKPLNGPSLAATAVHEIRVKTIQTWSPSRRASLSGPFVVACLIGCLSIAVPSAARAQETREQLIAQAQAEKAKQLKPYVSPKGERLLLEVYDTLVLQPEGFYPYFGSVYSGGGFTLGAGYRRFIGDRANWYVNGLYSLKNYKLIEVGLHSPRPLTGRFDYRVTGGWRDATQVAYHGLGIDSQEDRTVYRMQQGYFGGGLSFRPSRWSVLRGGVDYEAFTMLDGTGTSPDIDDIFTPQTAPGLGDSPDFVHSSASAAIDTRTAPDYTRRGGLYELAYHQYADVDDVYTFDRLDAQVVQHFPIVRDNWVFSFRGRLETTLSDTDVIPYFLFPSLGSGSTLRGYSSWRFRDRHSLLFSAEWRWIPGRALDAAIFYDTGTVADRRDALSLSNRRSDVGFGVRIHGPFTTPLRIELARGDEGLRIVFAASAAF